RELAGQGVGLWDFVKATGMQRRTLERRMKAALGRTPKEELLRIQMEDAKRMLTQTDLPIKRIAGLAGFASSRYFGRVFLARIGMTPGQYRKNAKTGR
ncbi:MAG: helix-turn-helix domain-containing protein, partial [Blastopirellula sp. JB062]